MELDPSVTDVDRYINALMYRSEQPHRRSDDSRILTLKPKHGALRQPADIDCLKDSLLKFPLVTKLQVTLVHKKADHLGGCSA
jgi:hypothetical protein